MIPGWTYLHCPMYSLVAVHFRVNSDSYHRRWAMMVILLDILMDAATCTGCVVSARALGVIEAKQPRTEALFEMAA